MADAQQGATVPEVMNAIGGIMTAAKDAGLLTPEGRKSFTVAQWTNFAEQAFDIMAGAGLTLADVSGMLKMAGPIVAMFVK